MAMTVRVVICWSRKRPGRAEMTVAASSSPIGKHPIPVERVDRYLRLMDAGEDVAHYLAEWYLPELTEQSVDDIVAKLDLAATTASDEGTPVRLLVTLAVPTDEVLYGVFHAYSPEIVTTTCQRAGFPHQRLSGDVGARIRHGPPAMGCVARTAAEPEPTVG